MARTIKKKREKFYIDWTSFYCFFLSFSFEYIQLYPSYIMCKHILNAQVNCLKPIVNKMNIDIDIGI
jgi:hypothetical protein